MVVYYWTNYKPKDTDTQYKRKHKLLEQVFDYCNGCGIEYHPINDSSHLILHVAIVSEKFNDLPKIKERFPFKTIKELLDNK